MTVPLPPLDQLCPYCAAWPSIPCNDAVRRYLLGYVHATDREWGPLYALSLVVDGLRRVRDACEPVVTVRISARRPNGTVAAFTVDGNSPAELCAQAVPALLRLTPYVPADAVWTAEPWTHSRPT